MEANKTSNAIDKLSKSEREVIEAIKGIKRLPYTGKYKTTMYKRHESAVKRLVIKQVIRKGNDDILEMVPKIKMTY